MRGGGGGGGKEGEKIERLEEEGMELFAGRDGLLERISKLTKMLSRLFGSRRGHGRGEGEDGLVLVVWGKEGREAQKVSSSFSKSLSEGIQDASSSEL